MTNYKLYVSMASAKFEANVEANFYSLKNNRLNFYGKKGNNTWLISSYPSECTIIEKITENEN